MTEFQQLRFQTSDGAGLNLLSAGTGKPLVMIPGWSQMPAR